MKQLLRKMHGWSCALYGVLGSIIYDLLHEISKH